MSIQTVHSLEFDREEKGYGDDEVDRKVVDLCMDHFICLPWSIPLIAVDRERRSIRAHFLAAQPKGYLNMSTLLPSSFTSSAYSNSAHVGGPSGEDALPSHREPLQGTHGNKSRLIDYSLATEALIFWCPRPLSNFSTSRDRRGRERTQHPEHLRRR
jgi:hypothetical protein